MPVLESFKALFYGERAGKLSDLIFVPGEEIRQTTARHHIRRLARGISSIPKLIHEGILQQDGQNALFIYRQRFCFPGEEMESVREGVTGLLSADARRRVLRHEETIISSKENCSRERQRMRANLSSLLLWCDDDDARIASLLSSMLVAKPWKEVIDQTGCVHQIWRVIEAKWIANVQTLLHGKELFLADGHHRFAAEWQLATIQIRSKALRTLAVHRLLLADIPIDLEPARAISNLEEFRAATPAGAVRFGVHDGETLLGVELSSSSYEQLLRTARTRPIRHVSQAIQAVRNGEAQLAFLLERLSVSEIMVYARRGALLPPQSTDFYPKLAEGLVLHRLDQHALRK